MTTIKIIKKPECEDDDYLLRLEDFYISEEKYKSLCAEDEYLKVKDMKFARKDTSKDAWRKFKDRPALRAFDKIVTLEGSIYTHTVQEKNGMTLDLIFDSINKMKDWNPNSRRIVVRVADSLAGYYDSEDKSPYKQRDTSCLAFMHYYKNYFKLIFRASDVLNELYYDILTCYWHFAKPIYGDERICIPIYSSTAQNIHNFDALINKIREKI